MSLLWQKCLGSLASEFPGDYDTWIRPLHALCDDAKNILFLFAPNRFAMDWVNQHFFSRINELIHEFCPEEPPTVFLEVGDIRTEKEAGKPKNNFDDEGVLHSASVPASHEEIVKNNLLPRFTFRSIVEGSANKLAIAAALQIVEMAPGEIYNPFFVYGGVGLGKTHLMHAIGNAVIEKKKGYKVIYLYSERFVSEMVRAIQSNAIDEFKRFYQQFDVLMIDDIQFLAGKERSQEVLFHIINALLEGQRQIILTSDRYHKGIDDMDERLKSRFGWGLTVAVEPPELETRVAILMSKAKEFRNINLSYEVAFFIAKRICSNVRELEGALKRVVANAHFTGKPITVDFAKEALKDLLSIQDKLVSIENIQKTVAEYYRVKLSDILSKRRNRSIAFPRQMAMALAKELTNHSLPEIGDAFAGRDHTTVIHACRKIKELISSDSTVSEDHKNLLRILTSF